MIATFPSDVLWIDVGVVHPTAKSHLPAASAFASRVHAAEAIAGSNMALNIMQGKSSPPVESYQTHKIKKYSQMLGAAKQQVRDGTRHTAPTFMACIMSHAGEISSNGFLALETITRHYKRNAALKHFEDGIPMSTRTADFRTRFKDTLMTANINGFGATIAGAGQPYAGRSRYSSPPESLVPEWGEWGAAY